MSNPQTVPELVARIEAMHERFATTLTRVSNAELEQERLPGGWSGKDLLAHLAFWDRRLLHAIAPDDGSNAFRLAPPLVADIPYDGEWVDRVNQRIYQLNHGRDAAALRMEFDQTGRQLRARVAALSEHDVFDADGLAASLGEPFLPMVTGAYAHYEEHLPDLEALSKGSS